MIQARVSSGVKMAVRDQVWAASGPYDLRGITSGVKKNRIVSEKVQVGIYAVGWPEWLTIDLLFNFNIAWICLK
jgi:hypothetical protein